MDSLFFIASKVLGLLASPGSLFIVFTVLAFLLLFTRWQRAGRRLLGCVLACGLFIAVLPLDEWLLLPLETHFPAEPVLPAAVDGIIILGGSVDTLASAEWQQPQLNAAAERLTAGIMLARRYPNARLVFTGGSGLLRYPNLREAEYVAGLFRSLGLPDNRVFFESASRNTHENALFTRDMVEPDVDDVWILVTSAAHMPRAVGVFCQADWSTVPWPVDHHSLPSRRWRLEFDFAGNLAGLNAVMHEYLGLIAYAVTGKSTGLSPEVC